MNPDEMMQNPAAVTGFIGIYFVLMAVLYIFGGLCLSKIAAKTNTPNGWMAWVPIAQIVLMLQIAKKPVWWIVLLFIPIANLVVAIITMMEIAKARNKPGWIGLLMIVPLVNLGVLAYLAFSD